MRISDWSSDVCSSDLRAMLISTHGFTLGREMMTTFDNREKAFEEKFAHDAEITFRIAARRNRLLGLWAAERMKLTSEEADAYAKAVVQDRKSTRLNSSH